MNHIVSVGKVKLHAGLYWSRLQSHQTKRKFIKEELKDLSSEYKQVFENEATVGAIHSTGIDIIIGVGAKPDGVNSYEKKDWLMSLVCLALLANPEKRSFIGRLRLSDDKDWMAVVRSGVVSPVGDLVVPREEADEAFSAIKERNEGLETLFDVTDSESAISLIETWLRDVPARKVPRVREISEIGSPPVSKRNVAVLGLLTSLVILGSYIGYSQYQNHVEQKEAQAEAERQAFIASFNRLGPVPKPWEDWPTVSSVAYACLTAYQEKASYKLGWQEIFWNCTGVQVTRNWQRTEVGSYTHLPVNEGFDLTRPNELSHVQELMVRLAPRGEEPISPKIEVARILMDAARLHGLSIRLEWGSEETRTYMQGEQRKVQRLGYSLNSGTLSGKGLAGVEILETLRKIPGLRLTGISKEGSDLDINIEFYTAV